MSTARKLASPAAFYAAIRNSAFAGKMAQAQVAGCNALVKACGEASWSTAWTAYAMATAFHETGATMQPVREANWLSESKRSAYFRRMYDIQGERPWKARELGNTVPGDGVEFHGRGYVQLTGRTNYANAQAATGVPLIGNPDLAMQPDTAAKIMVWGMSKGAFTGKSLADYLPVERATAEQFEQARRIINGQDKAAKIAGEAIDFQAALAAGEWA